MKPASDGAREPENVTADEPGFAELPEPLRTVAVETFRRLLKEGRPRDEALRVAADQAQEYEAARAPGATPE